MNLLMLSSDNSIARGRRGVFYHMLQEFSKYWDRIDVIAPRGPGAVERTVHGNVTVHPGNVPKPLHPLFILQKGTQIYRRAPFDLINIHTYPYFYNDIGGRRWSSRLGVPYMLDLMHIIGYPHPVDPDERIRRALSRLYFTYFARDMLGIRVINHQEVPAFLRRCGVPADKIHPLPCFYIDFDVFRPLNLPKTGRRVLYAGRLAKNKGLFDLLDAFRRVVDRVPGAELVILGGGTLEGRLRRRVQELGLEAHVAFQGPVPHTEVGHVYNACDLLVMPSYHEGGPRVVLEAMACGTAVLTTRVGITHEIIQACTEPGRSDGVNGLFIDWDPQDIAEKIVYLLCHPKVRDQLAAAGPAAVQDFEYSRMIRNYAMTYQALVREGGRTTNDEGPRTNDEMNLH